VALDAPVSQWQWIEEPREEKRVVETFLNINSPQGLDMLSVIGLL
jgi:hypothetical protein